MSPARRTARKPREPKLTLAEWREQERAKYDLPFSKLFNIGSLNDIEIEALMWDIDNLIEEAKRKKFGHRHDYCFVCNDAPCQEPKREEEK